MLIRGYNEDGTTPVPMPKPQEKLIKAPAKRAERKPPGRIPPWRRLALMRELADPKRPQKDMAVEYGVTDSAITLFKQKHAREIATIREHMDDKFAGLWVADKLNRIAMYEADIEAIEAKAQKDGATLAEADMLRVKGSFLRAVAEELGQLPARVSVTVTPVEHIIVGVNPKELT